jgi:hypothetical protein
LCDRGDHINSFDALGRSSTPVSVSGAAFSIAFTKRPAKMPF